MAKEMSQTERRQPLTMTDQHGRLWESTLDVTSMGTCAPINPRGWNAPLSVPMNYVRHQGKKDVTRVIIDYDRWIEDLKEAHLAYEALIQHLAQEVAPNAVLELIERPTPSFLRLVGPMPMPVELVIAAKQGNGWVLGKRQTPTTEADLELAAMIQRITVTEPNYGDEPEEEDFAGEEPVAPKKLSKVEA